MKMKRTFSVITLLAVLVLGLNGCTKQVAVVSLDKNNLDDRVAREKEEKEAEGKKSDDGINFSELTLIPDRGIITVKIENTTRVAKMGFVEIACLDEDGLQLKRSIINFDINALTDDIIQSNKIPSGTVSVKFLRTTVMDKDF